MFRNYTNSFISKDAITELGTLQFSSSPHEMSNSVKEVTTTTFNMSRDMAKAFIQQFLWTRLIESSIEPENRTYRDKGIWRLTSKGLCVLQEFCIKNKIDIGRIVKHVDAEAKLIFLIRIERLPENDRLNCEMKYLTCLFTILIASLPLRQGDSNSIQHHGNKSSTDFQSENGSTRSNIPNSSEVSCDLTFSDYFPHIQIIPNDLLVGIGYRYPLQFNQKSSFQQQRSLLHNLNPTSKKFRMRSIFSSRLCCDWLLEFCTVACTDEAENILTHFFRLGWITFYDEKHQYYDQVESSKSVTLNLTQDGMKVVVDVSLEKYKDVKQLKLQKQQKRSTAEAENDSPGERCSFASIPSNNYSDSFASSTFTYSQEKPCNKHNSKPEFHLPPVLQTRSLFRPSSTSDTSDNNFDLKTLAPYATKVPMNASPPPTPDSPIPSFHGNNNSIKLKTVLTDMRYRSIFREFLSNNFCVENLDFCIDYDSFHRNCLRKDVDADMHPSVQNRLLEEAYTLWETYLKPGASQELNIDHTLREGITEEISRVITLIHPLSRPVIEASSNFTYESLMTILREFDKVHHHICELMASDSIPKFIHTSEYNKLRLEIQQDLQEEEKECRFNAPLDKMKRLSTVTDDFDNFPSPPQRKIKEIVYL